MVFIVNIVGVLQCGVGEDCFQCLCCVMFYSTQSSWPCDCNIFVERGV